jgi:hypothetical protein
VTAAAPFSTQFLPSLSYGGVHTRSTFRNLRFVQRADSLRNLGKVQFRPRLITPPHRSNLPKWSPVKPLSIVFRRGTTDANMLAGILLAHSRY